MKRAQDEKEKVKLQNEAAARDELERRKQKQLQMDKILQNKANIKKKESLLGWAATLVRNLITTEARVEELKIQKTKFQICGKNESVGGIKRLLKKEANKVAANWKQIKSVTGTISNILDHAKSAGDDAFIICNYYLAEKLVALAEKFSSAAVAAVLCKKYPELWESISAQCFRHCCLCVPVFDSSIPGFKNAGAQLNKAYDADPVGERSSKEAIMTFYAFLLSSNMAPQGSQHSSRYGLGRAWSWLARLLNECMFSSLFLFIYFHRKFCT